MILMLLQHSGNVRIPDVDLVQATRNSIIMIDSEFRLSRGRSSLDSDSFINGFALFSIPNFETKIRSIVSTLMFCRT